MSRRRGNGPRPKVKKGMFTRLLKYVLKFYKKELAIVVVCLLVASLSGVSMSVFMQRLIDECITPGLELGWDAVLPKVISVLGLLACIYALGVTCSFIQTRTMCYVSQGSLKHLRDDMFEHMETLPIKYFDTHAHGDIMSNYTNDTDAIRQLIGQSLPNLFNSIVTIVSLVFVMLYYSLWLSLLVGFAIVIIINLVKIFGGKSAKFMVAQQKSLAQTEGFIEEMMT
ncbi:MAG: ABC transporter ATP-binding protein, partial [Erysipelotrichaceae bacterium]|nr:ABC transporter ATP-binding protein [Erysipelotrichaceae bacterium]